MTAEANNPEGPVILERFRLLKQLGEGGMGTVYYAEHVHLGSKHAVKALKAMGGLSEDLQQQMEARFLREAKVCASVKHPNLVSVTDFGASEGTLYLVMDFIDGEDLQEVIAREGGLSETMSLRILRDVSSAVGALHVKGVIHRDLKPPNVMIEKSTGRVMLTDLGIAKDLEGAGTQQMTQGILGTPAYMSPEQMVDTSKTGFESDVYALGATFFAMVACKDPFEGDNPLIVLQGAREQLFAYGSLGGVAETRDKLQLKPEVLQLLKDMTTYDRKKRISSCDDVVARIDTILAKVDASASAGAQQLEAGQAAPAGGGDDMTLFGMDELAAGPAGQAAPATAGGAALTSGQAPPPAGGVAGGLTVGRKPPSSGAGLGTAASLMRKPPVGPGAATPATLPDSEQGESAGSGTKKGTKSALEALAGGGVRSGAARPQKSFAAAWVLLLLVAAGGGGGGFYWYQYVYLPGKAGPKVEPTPPVTKPVSKPVRDPGQDAARDSDPETGPDGRRDNTATEPEAASEPAFDAGKAPKKLAVPLGGGVAMEFVIVPTGKFKIGSDESGDTDARPRRVIEFTRPFYIARFEVTAGQFAAYLNDAKPRNVGDMALDKIGLEDVEGRYSPFPDMGNHPVRSLSHEGARAFCRWLSKKTGLKVDLPGEPEWEYAARGPEAPVYPWGDEWDDALCNGGKKDDIVEVGSYPDGGSWCGAEDMAGNVFEWCADRYSKARYRSLPRKNPPVLGKGSSKGLRSIRGGAYCHDPGICRSSYRFGITGAAADDTLGFRVRAAATAAVMQYAADQ